MTNWRTMQRTRMMLTICGGIIIFLGSLLPATGEDSRNDTSSDVVLKLEIAKLTYAPNEQVTARVVLRNSSKSTEFRGRLRVDHIRGLRSTTRLTEVDVTLKPQAETSLELAVDVGDTLFGHEIRATLLQGDMAIASDSALFSVADNFWDVALGARNDGVLHSTGRYGEKTPQVIAQQIGEFRDLYSNWLEIDFWAPDDWGNLTPEEDEWTSGQGARLHSAKYLKAVIAEAHKHGIKAITYGKGLAGGPSAWELLRKNPELFMRNEKTGRWGTNPDLWDFEHWNDPAYRDKHYTKAFKSVWHRLPPDHSKEITLEHGIQELIGSAREYGWDGVRFDGHFTAVDDIVSTYNMRRLKESLWKEFPNFVFGFNSGALFDRGSNIPHEEREGMAGGSHWMQEGIGSWTYDSDRTYKEWRWYAENEQRAAQTIQDLGGTYHYIYRLRNCATDPIKYYKFVIGTLNGVHPCYGGHRDAPGCESWGRFLTRWGMLFWHPNRRPLDFEKTKISGVNIPKNMLWRHWSKSIPVSGDTEYLVFPYLMLPQTELIKETSSFPAVVQDCRMDFSKSPLRRRIKKAYWLTSEDLAPQPLSILEGVVNLPGIDRLGILVVEMSGEAGYQPVSRPRFTERVSPEQVAQSRATGNRIVVVDPLRPELNKAPGDGKVETKAAAPCSWSMKRAVFEDPDATTGRAAGADKKFPACVTGQYFWNLRPGRYKISARLKVEPAGVKGTPADWAVNIYENSMGKFKFTSKDTISKHFSYDLINSGKYQEVVLTEDYQHYGMFFLAVFIRSNLPGDAPADARFLLDWVRVERLEDYTDENIAAKLKLPKNVSTAVGAASSVLWIRGLYDKLYQIKPAVEAAYPSGKITEFYQRDIPHSAKALAGYGTIIMPNVPVEELGVEVRKVYRDWVHAGGHLVILGGPLGLGQGLMRGTYFEDLLPCKLLRDDDVVRLPENSRIEWKSGYRARRFRKGSNSQIYYAHVTEPKADADILARSGEIPLLMTIPSDKGRCTVFAGTVLGAKQDAPEAFWNSQQWLDMLTSAVKR